MIDSPVFFSCIGGSGMLPLASIVRASGAKVAGMGLLARRRAHAARPLTRVDRLTGRRRVQVGGVALTLAGS